MAQKLVKRGKPLLLHSAYVLSLVGADTDVLGLVVVPEGRVDNEQQIQMSRV